MKNDFLVNVTTPKSAALSPGRIAHALKYLIQVGQLLCKHTIDDINGDAAIEADALNLTIGVPKPLKVKPVRIVISVHGGKVQEVDGDVQGIHVTLHALDNAEVDAATNQQNEQIIESMNEELPCSFF